MDPSRTSDDEVAGGQRTRINERGAEVSAEEAARTTWRSIKTLALAGLALIAIVIVIAFSHRGGPSHGADKHATANLSSVKLGMVEPQIRQILGEPDSIQHSETDGVGEDTWQYDALGANSVGYRFVFEHGRLATKTRT